MVPDVSQWRSDAAYEYFDESSVSDLAWEGLRRNTDYQREFAELTAEGRSPDEMDTLLRARWRISFRNKSGPDGTG
ncbi:hypothetical protein IWQ54_002463 [Labrenzia sp. EL_195]|nr:hypothetical protein [Labrenzia sp. EL_195]